MRQLKILDNTFSLYGSKFGIPLCCLIWFCNVQCTIRAIIPEYQEQQFAYDNGIIQCPICLQNTLSNKGEIYD